MQLIARTVLIIAIYLELICAQSVLIRVTCESDTVGIICQLKDTKNDATEQVVIASAEPGGHGKEVVVEIALRHHSQHVPLDIGVHFGGIENLVIHTSSLRFLKRGDFTKMTGLEVLNFYNNKIESIPRDAFHDLRNLRHVDMARNRLAELHSELFLVAQNLRVLEMSDNVIEKIPDNFFQGKTKIWRVNFNNNSIDNFQLDLNRNFMRFKSLGYFGLLLNDKNCDISFESEYVSDGLQDSQTFKANLEIFECRVCHRCNPENHPCLSSGICS
jgi:Leucine-rich repeat (LRR) protein